MEQKLIRKVLQVGGMKDAGCEKNIENALNEISGIVNVKAMSASANVYLTYDANVLLLNSIIDIIEGMGYTVKNRPAAGSSLTTVPAKAGNGKAGGQLEGKAGGQPEGKAGSQLEKPNGERGRFIEKTLKIDGMTCTSCEMRIENRLKKMDGIVKAKVSYSSSDAHVVYDSGTLTLDMIIDAIEKLDYKASEKAGGKGRSESSSKDSRDDGGKGRAGRKADGSSNSGAKEAKGDKLSINQVLGIGIIILAAYVIIKNTVGFNFIPQVNQNMGYGVLFVIGLITSLHCIAMCGGINLSQCVSYKFGDGENSKVTKLRPSLLYNMGRVISYTIVGGIVGALGSVISFSGTAKGIVAIISGLFMVIMGINMLNIFPWLRKFNPRMPRIFGNKVHSSSGKRGPLYVGLLNGLMPCGPLQAMQIYALGTGSMFAGALSMFMFSVGTVPLMFSFGAVSSFLSGKFTHRMMKVSAVLVMVLGVIMLNRGLSLSGVNVAYAASITPTSGNVAKVEGNVQTVTTILGQNGYPSFIVQKGIPVKWDMKADAQNITSCNGTLTIPKYNIEKKLQPGDNIIEFTPDATGNITYTCWMGMISSNIKVVDDVSKVSASDISQANSSAGAGAGAGAANGAGSGAGAGIGGGGCCGAAPPGFAGGKIPTDNIGIAKINGNEQDVTVTVDSQGYSPAVIVLQRNIPAKIKFDPKQLSSCNSTVVFPEYQGQLDLSSQTETPLLTPQQDFTFQCGMNMLHGYVKVVDDINKVDLNAIRNEIKNYKPAAGSISGGGGGCCG